MNVLVVLGMAVALAMDCFAVSLGMSCGLNKLSGRQTFRLALHFALFQFAMPVIGWFAGENLLRYIERFDHWIAFALLAFVGIRMIRTAFTPAAGGQADDPSRGGVLIMLAIATSIDALAVGLSLAMIQSNVWYPSIVIGVVAGVMSILAIVSGARVGRWLGGKAQMVGGLVLLIIGVRILATHLA